MFFVLLFLMLKNKGKVHPKLDKINYYYLAYRALVMSPVWFCWSWVFHLWVGEFSLELSKLFIQEEQNLQTSK